MHGATIKTIIQIDNQREKCPILEHKNAQY
jgi:hypothetical protein